MRLLLFCLLLILCTSSAEAQLYVKVGYAGAGLNHAPLDALLQRYNQDRPYLDREFSEINILNGMDGGILYRVGPVGLEGGVELAYAQRRSDGIPTGTNTDLEERLFLNSTSYYLGLNVGTDLIYAGASLVRTDLKFKFSDSDDDDRRTILDAPNFQSLRVYLSIEPASDSGFRIALRPFLQMPLGDLNLRPLGEFFEPDFAATATDEEYTDGWQLFGLRILFYNGR